MNIQNNVTLRLDPALAAIFGPTITFRNISQSTYPSGLVSLTRNFRTSALGISYSRSITAGNGLYTTSRQESFDARVTYNGIRRWTLGVDGRYGTLIAIGQNLGNYGGYAAGAFGAYSLGHGIHFSGDYSYNHQTISNDSFTRSGSRVLVGIQFSKGNQAVGAF